MGTSSSETPIHHRLNGRLNRLRRLRRVRRLRRLDRLRRLRRLRRLDRLVRLSGGKAAVNQESLLPRGSSP